MVSSRLIWETGFGWGGSARYEVGIQRLEFRPEWSLDRGRSLDFALLWSKRAGQSLCLFSTLQERRRGVQLFAAANGRNCTAGEGNSSSSWTRICSRWGKNSGSCYDSRQRVAVG